MEKTIISPEEYLKLIGEGVRKHTPNVEEVLGLLSPDDFISLGEVLVERAKITGNIFPLQISPVIDLGKSKTEVHQTVKKGKLHALKELKTKNVYVLVITEEVESGQEEVYAKKHGLRLLPNASNYLFGIEPDKLHVALKDKDIVAIEENPQTVFLSKDDKDACYASLSPYGGKYEIGLVYKKSNWGKGGKWAILCEKPTF